MPAQLITEEVLDVAAGQGSKIMAAGEVGEELGCLLVGLDGPRTAVARPQAPGEGPQEQIVPRGCLCHEARLEAVGALC